MAVKRLISDAKKANITGSKAHKGADIQTISDSDLRAIVKILAEKAGIL